MQQTDIDGIYKRGVAARKADKSYYDNPFFDSTGPLEEWLRCCALWATGWLDEDAGRDQAVLRNIRMDTFGRA